MIENVLPDSVDEILEEPDKRLFFKIQLVKFQNKNDFENVLSDFNAGILITRFYCTQLFKLPKKKYTIFS